MGREAMKSCVPRSCLDEENMGIECNIGESTGDDLFEWRKVRNFKLIYDTGRVILGHLYPLTRWTVDDEDWVSLRRVKITRLPPTTVDGWER